MEKREMVGIFLAGFIGSWVAISVFAESGTVSVHTTVNEDYTEKFEHDGFWVILTSVGWIWVDGVSSSLSSEDVWFKSFLNPEEAYADAMRRGPCGLCDGPGVVG